MPYNTSTGVYTNVSGATTATAGAVIASATWNSIHGDYGTALTSLGQGLVPILSSVGIKASDYASGPVICNFAATAGSDIGTFNIALPSGATGFRLVSMRIYNAAGNLNSAVVSLYTSIGAGGTVVISSTATTITSSLVNTSNGAQTIIPASVGNVNYSATQLFLHVTSSTATSNTASVILQYEPYF